ncbi:MAG: Bax inhibitor-1/YccA family protein [Chitinophagaceae bacterium]
MALIDFKSGNPTLGKKAFQATLAQGEEAMTFSGTINKFMFMFFMLMCSAVFTWHLYSIHADVTPYIWGGMIGGFVLALVIMFKKEWSPYLAPAYGLMEGLFLGAISAVFNDMFKVSAPFIIMQAVLLTFGVVIAMLVLYKTRIIKVTNKFRMIVVGATAGIAVFYFLTIILGFFHVNIPFVYQGSTLGIIFSLVVVAIAALNLVLDFDMIDSSAEAGLPKYMEWYGAFGLMVTIVWLYLEILRLLAKLNSRR